MRSANGITDNNFVTSLQAQESLYTGGRDTALLACEALGVAPVEHVPLTSGFDAAASSGTVSPPNVRVLLSRPAKAKVANSNHS